MDDVIKEGEFDRQVGSLNRQLDQISTQVGDGFRQINARLDRVNGRLDKHDDAIGGIAQRGCGQLQAHRQMLLDLPAEARRSWHDWHPAAKVASAGGGIAGAGLLLEIIDRALKHFGI